MIEEPFGQLEQVVAAGADMITVHLETTIHPHRLLQAIGRLSNGNSPDRVIVRGVALNPGTPIPTLEPLLDEVDYVLLLAVNPGVKGQLLLRSIERRVPAVRETLSDLNRPVLLGVDGGIRKENVGSVASLGVDIVVAGSATFSAGATAENATFMLRQIATGRVRH